MYDRYASQVDVLALRILADERSAQNVVYEVFTTLPANLARAAAEAALMRHRLLARTQHRAVRLLRHGAAPPAAGPPTAAHGRRPATWTGWLAAVPEPGRELLTLAYFGGLTYSEIAARTAMSAPAAKAGIVQAVRRLRLGDILQANARVAASRAWPRRIRGTGAMRWRPASRGVLVDELAALRASIAAAVAQPGPGAVQRVGRACVVALPGDGAAISVMTGTQVWEAVATADKLAARLDEVQYSLGEGPSWEAFATGRPVLVPNLGGAAVQRWPAFVDAIAGFGVGAIFAFPLQVGAITIGVCAVYRRRVGRMSAEDLRSTFAITDVAAVALLGLRNPGSSDGLGRYDEGWLDGMSVDRRHVHQATGMLVGQLGVDAEAAFALLRAHAYSTSRLLGEVAAEIVAGTLRLDGDRP